MKTNLSLSQPLCLSPASLEISVNFINIADKLGDAQISPEINQLLQLQGEKVALFLTCTTNGSSNLSP